MDVTAVQVSASAERVVRHLDGFQLPSLLGFPETSLNHSSLRNACGVATILCARRQWCPYTPIDVVKELLLYGDRGRVIQKLLPYANQQFFQLLFGLSRFYHLRLMARFLV